MMIGMIIVIMIVMMMCRYEPPPPYHVALDVELAREKEIHNGKVDSQNHKVKIVSNV